MLKYVLISLGILVVVIVAFAGFRGQTTRNTELTIFDDMDDQPKYKNQGATPFFEDGRQMRPIPAGSVPWGREAVKPDKALLTDDIAAFELKTMPVQFDYALLQRGQKLYMTYCTVCHGAAGTGKGITVSYGQAPPANYLSDRLRQATDGYIYRVVTEGKGLMGPYGPSIKPEDRWAVVAYVRALQRAGSGTIEDVPENQRAQLQQAQ